MENYSTDRGACRLESVRSQRVGHDWVANTHTPARSTVCTHGHAHTHTLSRKVNSPAQQLGIVTLSEIKQQGLRCTKPHLSGLRKIYKTNKRKNGRTVKSSELRGKPS